MQMASDCWAIEWSKSSMVGERWVGFVVVVAVVGDVMTY